MLFGAIGEKECGFFSGDWGGGEHGVMAGGMEAEDDFASRGFFDGQPLGSDRHPPVGADLDPGPHAPDVMPPRAARDRTDHRTIFLLGFIPCPLRGLTQLAVNFVSVVVRPQGIDMGIGNLDFVDLFAGEVGRQPALPELVFAFDFAFGLRRGSVAQADVIELERPAQLREGVGVLGEEEAVVIDIELEGPSVSQESSGQEVEVSEQEFALVEFGAGEQAATVIQHVEHGKEDIHGGEPAVGRGIQLPEFANAGALPSTHRGSRAFGGSRMRITLLDGPVADLGAVELEGVQAQCFRGGEAIRARRDASQALFQEVEDRLGPSGGVVAAGDSGDPHVRFLLSTGAKVIGEETIDAAASHAELFGGSAGRQRALPQRSQHMADKGRCVAMG
jgi:hypothetical protein